MTTTAPPTDELDPKENMMERNALVSLQRFARRITECVTTCDAFRVQGRTVVVHGFQYEKCIVLSRTIVWPSIPFMPMAISTNSFVRQQKRYVAVVRRMCDGPDDV